MITCDFGNDRCRIASARLEKVFVKTNLHTSPIVVKKGVLTETIEKDPPWAMMFAEDLVLFAMTREEVEENLETWRVVFERHGLNISRTKTEYLPSPTNDTGTTVKSVDAELPTVTSFKYIGSLFTSEGGPQADVNNIIRIG